MLKHGGVMRTTSCGKLLEKENTGFAGSRL